MNRKLKRRSRTGDGPGVRRVAHVTTAHPARDNRIFRKECAALRQAGYDVHLVAVTPLDATCDGISLLALPRHATRLGRMLLGPIDAFLKLHQLQPDMIHVHDPELILMAILWRSVYQRPSVYDSHEDLPKQIMGKSYLPRTLRRPLALLARLLERAAGRHLDAIVAATPSIARNYPHSLVALVQNFPLLEDYPNPLPYPVGPVTEFSYVGGIANSRGGREMTVSVTTSDDDLRLTLAGSATEEMQEVMSSDATGRINYLGLLPAENVPTVVGDSNAGLVLFHPLPNHLECQPTKLFEYMAAARPFIASDFIAWRDLLERFECGYFVNPLDVGSIRSAMERIAASPNEAIEMGQRGRQALVANFTFENESRELVLMTNRLLGL